MGGGSRIRSCVARDFSQCPCYSCRRSSASSKACKGKRLLRKEQWCECAQGTAVSLSSSCFRCWKGGLAASALSNLTCAAGAPERVVSKGLKIVNGVGGNPDERYLIAPKKGVSRKRERESWLHKTGVAALCCK